MKNTIARTCAHNFLRAIKSTVLTVIALLGCFVMPVSAVQVWNIGDNFEQPPGTPKDQPHLIISGVNPDPRFLTGHRYINLKVISAGNGKPVENAMAYLVRLPDVPETVVFSTDSEGCATLWNIRNCYRKLVVTKGTVSVRQWVSLPEGTSKNIIVKLPFTFGKTVLRPAVGRKLLKPGQPVEKRKGACLRR